ncbi:GNAT family N-acetyltransferase [Bacillus sp. FJAT-45037]|uniref:GNAT family N-acetyltransferase n=1 Tax=Bacillus sp. FJAT-45037 TaxID=2011007 RepID=UPI000C24C11F|nr:GNAT family protein [Bacillus sp. FJAT-45037]
MLNSKNIRMRKMEKEDIEKYHQWRNDVEVMVTTSPVLDVYSFEETSNFVDNVLLNTNSSRTYIIELKNEKVSIGVTSLINIDTKNRNAECIIDVGEKEYWGNGYGTEAFKLLIDYAFLELNLHRLSLRVFSLNEKALHIYTKLGFVKEGVIRESLYRHGEWHDIIIMGILKKDYMNSNNRL